MKIYQISRISISSASAIALSFASVGLANAAESEYSTNAAASLRVS